MIQENGLAQKIRYAALQIVRKKYILERTIDESEKCFKKVKQEARSTLNG